jgi:hypothetical protein
VIRLQVTVEGLTEKHRGGAEIRAGLSEIEALLGSGYGGGKRKRSSGAPAPESVQRLKGELFAD